MSDIYLDNLERTTEQDLKLVEELKTNYRKISAPEALIILGKKKKITRVIDMKHSGKVLQSISLESEKDYFDNTYYYLTCDGYGFNSDTILKEIIKKEWFVKL